MFIGIDPGVTAGGYGVVDDQGLYQGCGHAQDLAHEFFLSAARAACIEAQSNRRTDSPGQQYGTGKLLIDYGRLLGILEARNVPVTEIYPITWRSHYGLIKASWRELIAKVQEMWPDVPVRLKKHDGMAVGLLLADYARTLTLKGE